MAMEPITLFARIADPAGVVRRLRQLVADLEIQGPDDDWRSVVVTFRDRKGWRRRVRTLTLNHDPAYYAGPGWSAQMNGMRGYFARFPDTDRKANALMLTTTFRFALGTIFEPDFDPAGDSRLDLLYEIADLLDGVLVTPSSLRDARGRILFGAGGEDEEDPDATWPRVLAEVSVSKPALGEGQESPTSDTPEAYEDASEPPSPARVARRALVLAAVTIRAILEQEADRHGAEDDRNDILTWIHETGIDDELEPDEWVVLQRPVGHLEMRRQINATWLLEGLGVLAWALGKWEIPPHDKLVDPNALWENLGYPDSDAARDLLAAPTLRPREEIDLLRKRLFALHWRLRNYHLRPVVMDFAEFARTCWFGPLDLTGLPLVKGDLALGGKRIDRVSADAFSRAHSAARERHQAANWLWEGPARYSEASVAT